LGLLIFGCVSHEDRQEGKKEKKKDQEKGKKDLLANDTITEFVPEKRKRNCVLLF